MAVGEHAVHVGDIARIESAYIQGREFVAVPEHAAHAGNAARVKVT